MKLQQKTQKVILSCMGFLVLLSYVFLSKCSKEYLWADIPEQLRYVFLCFMPLAACGLIYVAWSWTETAPTGWICNHYLWIMILFCIFASCWSLGMIINCRFLVSASLFVCAILSIVLLEGACHSRDFRVIIALVFVTITTVIFDCVVWQTFYFAKASPRIAQTHG